MVRLVKEDLDEFDEFEEWKRQKRRKRVKDDDELDENTIDSLVKLLDKVEKLAPLLSTIFGSKLQQIQAQKRRKPKIEVEGDPWEVLPFIESGWTDKEAEATVSDVDETQIEIE